MDTTGDSSPAEEGATSWRTAGEEETLFFVTLLSRETLRLLKVLLLCECDCLGCPLASTIWPREVAECGRGCSGSWIT